jgi:hypothetical protein
MTDVILRSYPKAKVTKTRIPGSTGKLECIVNGKDFAHSKKNGDGYLDAKNCNSFIAKLKKIVEAK